MSKYYKILTLTILVLLGGSAYSQNDISVTTGVMQPYPKTLEEMIKMLRNTTVSLKNNKSQNYEVTLGLELKSSRGVSLHIKPATLSDPIILDNLEVKVLSGFELENIMSGLTPDDIEYKGIDPQDFINNPNLPEGVYTLCVRAYDNLDLTALSLSSLGCAPPFWVKSVDPPKLINPKHKSTLTIAQYGVQNILINWTPTNLSNPNLRYEIDIREIDTLVNPYDAFRTNNYYFYSEKGLISNTFFYGANRTALNPGYNYGIRVRAYLEDGSLSITNDGWSQIIWIRTVAQAPPFDKDKKKDDPDKKDPKKKTTENDSLPKRPPLPLNLACGSSAVYDTAGISRIPSTSVKKGDTIRIGLFDVILSNTRVNGNKINGEATVAAFGYIPIGIKVKLKNVMVNAQHVAFSGSATAMSRGNESWINATWTDAKEFGSNLEVGNNSETIFDKLSNGDYYLNTLKSAHSTLGTTLPIGYGDGPYKLNIVGFELEPQGAFINVVAASKFFSMGAGKQHLIFGARRIPIHPGGLATTNEGNKLKLLKSLKIKYGTDVDIVFTGVSQPNTTDNATSVSFDCDGLKEFAIAGKVKLFPNEIYPEVNGKVNKSDTMLFKLFVKTASLDDWIVELDLENNASKLKSVSTKAFQFKRLEGFSFTIDKLYIDHSPQFNPPNITFPEDYNQPEDMAWEGIYANKLVVLAPRFIKNTKEANGRTKFEVNNLIKDKEGFTLKAMLTGLMSKGDGSLGGWDYYMDSLTLDIQKSNINGTMFSGYIKTPLNDSIMPVRSLISFVNDETDYQFRITLNENLYTIPAWYAKADIGKNSTLSIHVDDQEEVDIEMVLHGKLSFAEKMDNIPGMNLKGLDFQGLTIRNKKNPKYIEFGNFGSASSLSTPMIAGFAVGLAGVAVAESGLSFGTSFNLSEKVSGSSEFEILSKLVEQKDKFSFESNGTRIKRIALDKADLGAVIISGSLEFIKNDPLWGNGFDGSLTANFIDKIELGADVLFGKTPGKQGFNYWYVYGQGKFPVAIPLAEPIRLYGFGGGAYYNLKPKAIPPKSTKTKVVKKRDYYTPTEGYLGLKAGVTIGTYPSPKPFNGDITLGVTINTKTWGLSNISLDGETYLMSSFSDRDEAPATANAHIGYDFEEKVLAANIVTAIKVPPKDSKFTGGGTIDLLISPTTWHFKAGTPDNKLGVSGKFDDLTLSLGAYFMMGQNLPAPTVPEKITTFLNYTPQLTTSWAAGAANATGFAAGFQVEVNVPKIDLTVANMRLQGIAGFDIAVKDYSSCLCSKQTDFGMQKFYAHGIGYLYTDAKFTISDFEVLNCKLGAIAEGALPNPSGFAGVAKASLTFFGEDYDIDKRFEVGKMCKMEPVVDAKGQPTTPSSPIENYVLIESINVTNGEKDVPLSHIPIVKLGIDKDKSIEVEYSDGSGGTIQKRYTYKTTFILKYYKKNNIGSGAYTNEDYKGDYLSSNRTYSFGPTSTVNGRSVLSMLKPSTKYKLIAKITIQEYDFSARQYVDSKYTSGSKKGQAIEDIRIIYFETEVNSTAIAELHIDRCIPNDRQRYVTKGDLPSGWVIFNTSQKSIFDNYTQNGYRFYAVISDINGNNTVEKNLQVDAHLAAYYTLPPLLNETTYKVEFIAKKKDTFKNRQSTKNGSSSSSQRNVKGNPNYQQKASSSSGSSSQKTTHYITKVLYTSYFRTSKYNTMQDKFNAMSFGTPIVSNYTVTGDYTNRITSSNAYKVITLTINGQEPFDEFDILERNLRFGHALGSDAANNGNAWENWYTSYESWMNSTDRNMYASFNPRKFEWQKKSMSNEYRYVNPPLSDFEIGLSSTGAPSLNSGNTVLGAVYYGEAESRVQYDYLSGISGLRTTAKIRLNLANPELTDGNYLFNLTGYVDNRSNNNVSTKIEKNLNISLTNSNSGNGGFFVTQFYYYNY